MNDHELRSRLRKVAGARQDAILSALYGAVPVANEINLIGGLVGLASRPDKESALDLKENGIVEALPGMAGYRSAHRLNVANAEGGNRSPRKTSLARNLAFLTSLLAPTAAGAGIGALSETVPENRMGAAILGGGVGLAGGALANLVGTIAGFARGKDKKAVKPYASGLDALDYLVPGVNTYRAARLARATD